jgi:uncharacterized protein (DUF2249 family)
MNDKVVRLDVRQDLQQGREPFYKIMQAVAQLKADENLLLVAPFKPVPLFGLLDRQGFSHRETQLESGDWEVLFSRNGQSSAPVPPAPAAAAAAASPQPASANPLAQLGGTIRIDARGWEPPQPLVKILESLAALPSEGAWQALTDRRLIHLYPHPEERGFTATTEEQADGSYLTHITRA